jgi:pimeloyl-ACP methyl ester carboxylesterase
MASTQMLTYSEFRNNQQEFNSTDGQIMYTDQGEGPVIFLLHGVPTSSWIYRNMIPDLVQRGYRVIAADMLGYGNSDNPKGYDIYNPKNHAKRILELMNALEIDQWTHLMHDVGGLWTWALLDEAPNRIDQLILLNTIVYEEGFNPPIRMKQGPAAKFSMWMYRNGVTTNLMLALFMNSALENTKLDKEAKKGYKLPWL